MKTIEEYIKTLSLEEKASQLYQTAAIYLKATEAENTGVVDGIYLSKEQLYNVGSILNFSNAREVKELSDRPNGAKCVKYGATELRITEMKKI